MMSLVDRRNLMQQRIIKELVKVCRLAFDVTWADFPHRSELPGTLLTIKELSLFITLKFSSENLTTNMEPREQMCIICLEAAGLNSREAIRLAGICLSAASSLLFWHHSSPLKPVCLRPRRLVSHPSIFTPSCCSFPLVSECPLMTAVIHINSTCAGYLFPSVNLLTCHHSLTQTYLSDSSFPVCSGGAFANTVISSSKSFY